MNTSILRWVAAPALAVASLVAIPAAPATAAPADHVIINEAYLNGGSAGATYKNKFVELYNPTDQVVDLNDWTLQYRSGASIEAFALSTVYDLEGTIQPGGYFLISGSSNGSTGAALPTPDQVTTLAPAVGGGTLALVSSIDPVPGVFGDLADGRGDANQVVDLLGYGSTNTFETAVSPGPGTTSNPRSITRTGFADTDDNSADFGLSASGGASPVACGAACAPATPAPLTGSIAQIQGDGPRSEQRRGQATTQGVVTAVYKTGGFSGAYIQTPGTGGPVDVSQRTASDGIFVFGSQFAADVAVGELVEVTGTVVEFQRMTELTFPTWTKLGGTPSPVTPAQVAFPLDDDEKESLEGMLLAPAGPFTVTDNFTTNQYAEIGLAPGTRPFDTPTNVVAPGAPAVAKGAQNAEALVTLDDGATTNFLSQANKGIALPWLRPDNEVRVGAPVTFTQPMILDYRNYGWKLQPRAQLLAGGAEPVTFGSTRAAKPKDVGGEIKLATFNVLNYFPTTGTDYVAANAGNKCSYFTDRSSAPITTEACGNPTTSAGNGPRGAANPENFLRQQAKIVTAINTLDADVVSLEEIENSAAFGQPRDTALNALVSALNTTAGRTMWAAVPSPATVPTTGEDVIRTAFIYQPAKVSTVGTSTILDDPAFVNARAPLAQTFAQVGKPSRATFAVIVNHFKSKGSGSGADADQGDGQGASNPARVKQATALVGFVDDVEAAAGTDQVFLTGDFNSYNEEDSVQIIEEAGFVNLAEERTDKETYQFDGAVGSLDHVFASTAADDSVTGTDIWNINSYESLAREYSRYNYNVTNLYDASPFRASDHDPEIVGFTLDASLDGTTTTASAPATSRDGGDVTISVGVSGEGAVPSGTVVVSEGGTELGRRTLVQGAASVVLDGLSVGTHELTVSYGGDATHSGSTATLATEVLRASAGLTATTRPGTYGTGTTVDVIGAPGSSGMVYVSAAGQLVGMGLLVNGTASVPVSSTLPVGTTPLTVFYAGNGSFDPSSTTTSVTVGKASSVIRRVSVSPTKIVEDRTKPFVTLSVTGAGFSVDGGTVTVRASGRNHTGTVRDGKVRIRLGRFTSSGPAKKVTATYSGNGVANGSTTSFTVKVRKR